jgi:serine/threonine protein kinase
MGTGSSSNRREVRKAPDTVQALSMDLRHSKAHFQAVNQYVIKEKIGGGGMGTVYLAFDVQLKRDVALKVLNALDQGSLERFVREREITADLDHPNFVRILSMGYLSSRDGLWPFYTMPLLRGETLASLIRRRYLATEEGEKLRAEVTMPRLLSLIQQICLAVESAHQKGIIHRDLKPANIVLGPYGELYIVDLGLAKYLHEEDGTFHDRKQTPPPQPGVDRMDLTGAGAVGTPFFMAPEQIVNPSTVDARGDVFGIGAILYCALTGRRPLYLPAEEARGDFVMPQEVEADPPPRSRRQPDRREPEPPPKKAGAIPRWHEDDEVSTQESRTRHRADVLNYELVSPDRLVARRRSTDPVLDPIDPALTAICLKAMARKPEDRYPSCKAMWREIEQYLDGRAELILSREGSELARSVSRDSLSTVHRDFELAERRLHQRILERESTGRHGIEEKLDLFDLLLGKAKIAERQGDSLSTIRAVTRVEPVIETTLEVVQRQYIQLLMAKGTALSQQEDFAGARTILAKAIALARIHKHDDLVAAAYCAYGIACSGTGDPGDYHDGLAALEDSITFSDRSGDVVQGVHSRVGLARLHMNARLESEKVMTLLDAALGKAGGDPALKAEVHLALGACHLGRREWSLAVRHLDDSMRHANEIDAQNFSREAHFLLGQAYHGLGQESGCIHHFRQALRFRGVTRNAMERKVTTFCRNNRINLEQLRLDRLRDSTRKLPILPATRAPAASESK